MSEPEALGEDVRAALERALSGEGAHVGSAKILDGLDFERAGERPAGSPHSVFQVVNHLVFWQDHALAWLAGEKPRTPAHDAESWPGPERPADRTAWEEAAGRFTAGLERLRRHAAEDDLAELRGPKPVLYVLQIVAAHNSYHLGQVVLLRQQLGAWPPPGGGFTW